MEIYCRDLHSCTYHLFLIKSDTEAISCMQYSDELTKGISTGSEWCASLPSWTACLILLPNYSDFEGFHVPNTTYIAIFTTQKAVLNKHISQNMGFV